jgi:hypothetical protein
LMRMFYMLIQKQLHSSVWQSILYGIGDLLSCSFKRKSSSLAFDNHVYVIMDFGRVTVARKFFK